MNMIKKKEHNYARKAIKERVQLYLWLFAGHEVDGGEAQRCIVCDGGNFVHRHPERPVPLRAAALWRHGAHVAAPEHPQLHKALARLAVAGPLWRTLARGGLQISAPQQHHL